MALGQSENPEIQGSHMELPPVTDDARPDGGNIIEDRSSQGAGPIAEADAFGDVKVRSRLQAKS